MFLWNILVAIGKIAYPFLKENLLQNGTLKDFIGRNRVTCAWLTMMVIMLGAQIYLFDSTMLARRGEIAARHEATLAKSQLTLVRQHMVLLETDRQAYKKTATDLEEQLTALQKQYSDLAESNDKYENWLQHCGVNLEYQGSGYPQCKSSVTTTRKATPKRAVPSSAPTQAATPDAATVPPAPPEKKGFWNGLKQIFSSEKSSEPKHP